MVLFMTTEAHPELPTVALKTSEPESRRLVWEKTLLVNVVIRIKYIASALMNWS